MSKATHNLAHELDEAGRSVDAGELGTKLAAMVEAEAAKAEAGDPDEPAPPDSPLEPDPNSPLEPPPDPDPDEPLPEPELMGVPCPLCAGSPHPGFIPFDIGVHPRAQTCETCKGFGEVLTGSMLPDNATTPCPDCNGRGYSQDYVTPVSPEAPASPEGATSEYPEIVPVQVPTLEPYRATG